MILFYTMLLTTTIYLGLSRATITDRLRPKIPLPIAKFTACSMCSGAWLGAAVAAAAWAFGYTYPSVSEPWHAIVLCFAGSALWTPLLAALVMFAIWYLGTPTDLVARLEEAEDRAALDQLCQHGYNPPACPTCKS